MNNLFGDAELLGHIYKEVIVDDLQLTLLETVSTPFQQILLKQIVEEMDTRLTYLLEDI